MTRRAAMLPARARAWRSSISPIARTTFASTRTGRSSTRTFSCAGGYDARYHVSETALVTRAPWTDRFGRLRSGEAAIVALLAVVLAIVLPPFLFLIRASLAIGSDASPRYALHHFIALAPPSAPQPSI